MVESRVVPREEAQSLEFYISSFQATLPPGAGGAIVSFTGIVRSDPGDSAGTMTREIHVECIPDLATRALQSIAAEVGSRSSIVKVALVHFSGIFTPGDAMVHVLVCGKHRHDAFKALADAVDMYKHEAPMWKKEVYSDGSSAWKA